MRRYPVVPCITRGYFSPKYSDVAASTCAASVASVAAGTDVPQTTLYPLAVDVPHTTDEFVTIYTLPFESTATSGDRAEPIVDVTVSVFVSAALFSKETATTVKM